MMNSYLRIQKAITVMLALLLALAVPAAIYAKDGKKHFDEGLKYASNRQWDEAARRFALAVAEKPNNIEYQLHFHRSLVNAAIMLVERGDTLFEQKDYNAAYNAYRQAYAFDRSNELALIKMRRMLEMQGLETDSLPSSGDPAGPRYRKGDDKSGVFRTSYNGAVVPVNGQLPGSAARRFPRTNVIARSDSLKSFIEQLGQDMGLNVIFDQQAERQIGNLKLNLDLRDVTKPRALEMILQTNNLMYAQIDSRTIVIASDNPQTRSRYEPLSVRTFYIKNGDLSDIRNAITATLQTKNIVPVKQLNALVVRDTPTNLELIESLIDSLDKSKAEVLIDINIYEVSRNDLLQLGNQFNVPGDGGQERALNLGFLGGIGQQGSVLGLGPRTLTGPFAFALGLPPSLISFFQDKGKAKLLASTQIHVLDQETNVINIGQRVPVQTAFIPTFSNTVATGRNNNNVVNPNQPGANLNNLNNLNLGANFGFNGGGFPQFQYENVGLNIDMKPEVFEDEVQLKMKIDTSTIDRSTGNFTPSFNQRAMTSVARIKDGQPTLIAGVSQTETSKQVKGIPLVGLIPILGRFFSTPSTVDRQSDVVITVTPHILRRADIREEDHLAKAAGTQSDPRTQLTIEQILYLADLKDAENNQLASATNQNQPYEPPKAFAANVPDGSGYSATIGNNNTSTARSESPGVVVTPPDRRARPNRERRAFTPTVERKVVENPGAQLTEGDPNGNEEGNDENNLQKTEVSRPVNVSVRSAPTVAAKNQDIYVVVNVDGNAELSSTNIALNYDPNILEVKGVRDGGVLQVGGIKPELHFTSESGALNVQLSRPAGASGVPPRGTLLMIIFKVKEQGISPLTLVEGQTAFYSPSGEPLPLKLTSSQLEAK